MDKENFKKLVVKVFNENKLVQDVKKELGIDPVLSFDIAPEYTGVCAYVNFEYGLDENRNIISSITDQVIHFNIKMSKIESSFYVRGLNGKRKTVTFIEFTLIHEMRHIYQYMNFNTTTKELISKDCELRVTGLINTIQYGMQPLEDDADNYALKKEIGYGKYKRLRKLISSTICCSHRATYVTDELKINLGKIFWYIGVFNK